MPSLRQGCVFPFYHPYMITSSLYKNGGSSLPLPTLGNSDLPERLFCSFCLNPGVSGKLTPSQENYLIKCFSLLSDGWNFSLLLWDRSEVLNTADISLFLETHFQVSSSLSAFSCFLQVSSLQTLDVVMPHGMTLTLLLSNLHSVP